MPDPAAKAEPAASDPAAALAARVEAFRRRHVVVDYANRGLPIPEIAARLDVSEEEARTKLREALARMLPRTSEEFAALQMSRLNEALLVAFSALGDMGLKAVDRVLRIVRALDRYQAAARPLALAAGDHEAEPAPLAATRSKTAAAPCERNPVAAQPFQKSQIPSQQSGQATASQKSPPRGDATPAVTADGAGEFLQSLMQRLEIPRFTPGVAAPAGSPDERPAASPAGRAGPASQKTFAATLPGGVSVRALAIAGP